MERCPIPCCHEPVAQVVTCFSACSQSRIDQPTQMLSSKIAAMLILLLLHCSIASPAGARPSSLSPPSRACPTTQHKFEVTTGDSFEETDPTQRCAIIDAVANGLLTSGSFRMVHDRSEIARATALMKTKMRKQLGLEVTFGRCDWVGLVSQGTANGDNSYGGQCKVMIGNLPPRLLLICASKYGGATISMPDTFALGTSFYEIFIRRACI